jgi:hypothetical protein
MLEGARRRRSAADQRTFVYRNQGAVATDRSGEAAVCHEILLLLAKLADEIVSGIGASSARVHQQNNSLSMNL